MSDTTVTPTDLLNAAVRDRLRKAPHVMRDVAIIRAVASCARLACDGLVVARIVDYRQMEEKNLIGHMVYLAKIREEIVAAIARETGVDIMDTIAKESNAAR